MHKHLQQEPPPPPLSLSIDTCALIWEEMLRQTILYKNSHFQYITQHITFNILEQIQVTLIITYRHMTEVVIIHNFQLFYFFLHKTNKPKTNIIYLPVSPFYSFPVQTVFLVLFKCTEQGVSLVKYYTHNDNYSMSAQNRGCLITSITLFTRVQTRSHSQMVDVLRLISLQDSVDVTRIVLIQNISKWNRSK